MKKNRLIVLLATLTISCTLLTACGASDRGNNNASDEVLNEDEIAGNGQPDRNGNAGSGTINDPSNNNRTDDFVNDSNITDDISNVAQDAADTVGDVIDNAGNAVEDVADGAGNAVEDATDGASDAVKDLTGADAKR